MFVAVLARAYVYFRRRDAELIGRIVRNLRNVIFHYK